MAIPLIGGFSPSQLSSQIGSTYQPKQQRLMVGRDVAATSWTSTAAPGTRNIVVGNAEDTRFSSNAVFNTVKQVAQMGFHVQNFRTVSNKDGHSGVYNPVISAQEGNKTQPSVTNGNYNAAFDGKSLVVSEKFLNDKGKEEWRVVEEVEIKSDTRLVWNKEGKPSILTGAAALTDGKLAADSDSEILIRKSGAEVQAGSGTMVINLGGAGTFKGGDSVTYLGSYVKSTIEGGSGHSTYGGYFANSQITALEESNGTFSGVFEGVQIDGGNGGNEFSGYFKMNEDIHDPRDQYETVINGGNGKNSFSGLFLQGSILNGGDDQDKFNGRYVDSKLNGGAGNDIFGSGVQLNRQVSMFMDDGKGEVGKVYTGLESDFVGSIVEGGEGDDTFNSVAHGTQVNLGEGNDNAHGVFSESKIKAGEGDDNVSAMYAKNSIFETGLGNDKVDLATAIVSSVVTDMGKNTVTVGREMSADTSDGKVANTDEGDGMMGRTTWQTRNEFFMRARPDEHGQLRGNSIEASRGNNDITVNSGNRTHHVTAAYQPGQEPEETGEEKAVQSAASGQEQPGEAVSGAAALTANSGLNQALLNLAAQNGRSLLDAAKGPEQAQNRNDEGGESWKDRFLSRYVRVGGDAPREAGAVAASVSTGVGDPLVFNAAERLLQRNSGGAEGRDIQRSSHHTDFGGETRRLGFMI